MTADRLCIMPWRTQTLPQEMYPVLYTNTVNPLCKLFIEGKHLIALKMWEQIWEKQESNVGSV